MVVGDLPSDRLDLGTGQEMTAEEKAELVSIGSADIDEDLLPEMMKTTATAGPGAGGTSFFIRSGNRRVRLTINRNSPLKVVAHDGGVAVVKENKIITHGVLERPLWHCPQQAYITISEQCIYNCRFCPVPKLPGGVKDIKTIIKMVEEANATGELRAISLTSGIAESPYLEAERTVEIVKVLSQQYDLPIGVAIYPTWRSTEDLFAAGATEIKYNVETMDPTIFHEICPGLSHQFIIDTLGKAVTIFGKNRVMSNFIIGLGEDDACVREGVVYLSSMGVIPILRPIAISPLRKGELKANRPNTVRLLQLSTMTRQILDRYDLRADRAQTMCLPCTGCDITPHRDV